MQTPMNNPVHDEMLRCNPSQIQLTTSDIGDLESHRVSRRRALSNVAKGEARLSTGPRLLTIIAAAHENGTRHSLTATVHPSSHRKRDSARRPQYDMPARGTSAITFHPDQDQLGRTTTALYHDPVSLNLYTTSRDDGPVKIDTPQALPSSDPYLNVPPLAITADSHIRDRRRKTSPSRHLEMAIDGVSASGDVECLESSSTTGHNTPMHAGRQVFRELPGSDGHLTPHTDLRRMSATRTRHNKSRSHEHVSQLQEDFPGHLPHTSSPRRSRPQRHDPSATLIARDLDPGAPVFTPRVRFGSTTVVPERDIEDVGSSNLRLCSPSEQNSVVNHTRHSHVSVPALETRPRRPRSNAVITRSRQSSENSVLPLPHLERYPLLLPTARNNVDRESQAPVQSGSSRAPAQSTHLPSLPLKSPGSSSSSREETPASRIPSIISAASGISKLSISDDAAAEFLQFRPSPLDGLTAELSRLSAASSPVAVAGEGRVSLLTGNPFDVSNTASHDADIDLELSELDPHVTRRDAASPKLLASPSRFTLPCSPTIPNAPMPRSSTTHVQASPSKSIVEVKTPSRQQTTTTTATPKVPIYNDAAPAHLQPQKSADLHCSSRRSRNRSDSSFHRETFCVGQLLMAPRPPIPERRAYRNTYPANVAIHGSSINARTDDSADSRHGNRGETENGAQGLLPGLESDRAVWVRRRQGGSLEVTPPGQGRFERFLD